MCLVLCRLVALTVEQYTYHFACTSEPLLYGLQTACMSRLSLRPVARPHQTLVPTARSKPRPSHAQLTSVPTYFPARSSPFPMAATSQCRDTSFCHLPRPVQSDAPPLARTPTLLPAAELDYPAARACACRPCIVSTCSLAVRRRRDDPPSRRRRGSRCVSSCPSAGGDAEIA